MTKTNTKTKAALFTIIGFLVIVGIILGGWFYISNNNSQKTISQMTNNITELNKTISILTDPVNDYVIIVSGSIDRFSNDYLTMLLAVDSATLHHEVKYIGKACISFNNNS